MYARVCCQFWLKQIQFTPRDSFSKIYYNETFPSQWPRGLRHEPSSPARTLGSWVRITLETWMSVCVYSVFVLYCV
jgi:hypothetical protein